MWSHEPQDYICGGVRVRSAIEMRYPRSDRTGLPDVVVESGRVDSPDLPDGAITDFFATEADLTLTVRDLGRFRALAGNRVVVDTEAEAAAEDVRLYLGGSVMGAIWLQRGQLPLHASAVELPDGGCAAFMGVMGAGKSSLAAHMANAGHALVTDDVAVLTQRGDGFAIWPGPSRVKLASDTLDSLEADTASLPAAGGTRGKYHLAVPGLASIEAPIPLRALFLLSWDDARTVPGVEPLRGLDAVDAIGGHTYRQEFVHPLGVQATWLRQVAEVARIVPAMRLMRPRGYDRIDAVIDAILTAVPKDMGMKVVT